MADIRTPESFTDAELRAYLADQADTALREALDQALEAHPSLVDRLAALDDFAIEAGPAIAAAFDALLDDAPMAALRDGLARAVAEFDAQQADDPSAAHPSRRRALAGLAASVAAAFAGGLWLGRGPFAPAPEPPAAPGWLAQVEAYMRLYTAESFADPQTSAEREQAVAFVGDRVEKDLSGLAELPGLAFQRAQILELNGRPLAQLIYLDEAQEPLAVCILLRPTPPEGFPQPPAAPAYAQNEIGSFNVVHWNVQPRGFLVMGRLDFDRLSALAQTVSERTT